MVDVVEGEQSHLEVARTYVDLFGYRDDPRVRAVFIIGSTATGQDDSFSDVDMLVAVREFIPDAERVEKMRALGCYNIMLNIAGLANPALPVASETIDKFVFRGVHFDVSQHLPHQLQFCFDYLPLVDKEDLADKLCAANVSHSEAELRTRVLTDLRLLYARIDRYEKYCRRGEWIGLDLSAIKNLSIDVLMVVNERPNYNRYSSRITGLIADLSLKPRQFDTDFLDILHLDNRTAWLHKVELLQRLHAGLLALAEQRWGPIPLTDDESLASSPQADE